MEQGSVREIFENPRKTSTCNLLYASLDPDIQEEKCLQRNSQMGQDMDPQGIPLVWLAGREPMKHSEVIRFLYFHGGARNKIYGEGTVEPGFESTHVNIPHGCTADEAGLKVAPVPARLASA